MISILRHRRGAWIAVAGATLIIYLTLPLVRIPLALLRQHGILNLVVNSSFILVVGVVLYFLVARWGERRVVFYVAFALVCAIYLYVMITMELPEERIHFLEYGLLGVLSFNAVRIEMRGRRVSVSGGSGGGEAVAKEVWLSGLVAVVLTFYLGWLDEMLQGSLGWMAKSGMIDPAFRRFYGWHDVYMNGIGGLLAIVLTCLHFYRRPPTEDSG